MIKIFFSFSCFLTPFLSLFSALKSLCSPSSPRVKLALRILKKSLSEIILSFTDAVLGLKKAGLYLSEARLGISKKIKAGFGLTKAGLYLPTAEFRSERLGLSF